MISDVSDGICFSFCFSWITIFEFGIWMLVIPFCGFILVNENFNSSKKIYCSILFRSVYEIFKQVCLVKIFQEVLCCAKICQPQLQQRLTWHCHLVPSTSFCFISSFLNVLYHDKVIRFDGITNLVESKTSKIILPWTLFRPEKILSPIIWKRQLQLNIFSCNTYCIF